LFSGAVRKFSGKGGSAPALGKIGPYAYAVSTVSHPSSSHAQCRETTLIETNVLLYSCFSVAP